MRKVLFFIAFLSLLGLWQGPAMAGPVESPAEIAVNPANPSEWVVRWDFAGGGLLYSFDSGSSWRVLCNSAIDPALTKDTDALAVTPGGDVFTGDFSGLWRVTNKGCGHEKVAALEGRWVSEVRNDPDDPNLIYAITSNGGVDPVGLPYLNGIYTYDDSTGSWTETGSREAVLISRLRVVKTDSGKRFYQSTAVPGGPPDYRSTIYVRYSDDGGATWTQHEAFNDGTTQSQVRLEAVDPTNPNRIVLTQEFLSDAEGLDRIWLSEASGAPDSWVMVGEVAELGGVAFAPDGRLWFGDNLGGLFLLEAGATSAVQLGTESLQPRCLHFDTSSDTLLACRLTEVVAVAEDGSTTPRLDFKRDVEWLDCPGTSVAAACQNQLAATNWCNITHYPEANICADYCYPGLNGDVVTDAAAACPAGTVVPEAGDMEPGVGVDGGNQDDPTDTDGGQAGDGSPPPPPAIEPPPTVTPPTTGSSDDGGGCQLSPSGASPVAAWSLVGMLGLWLRRRRGC